MLCCLQSADEQLYLTNQCFPQAQKITEASLAEIVSWILFVQKNVAAKEQLLTARIKNLPEYQVICQNIQQICKFKECLSYLSVFHKNINTNEVIY